MCGILAIFKRLQDQAVLRKRALELTSRIRHRGPDWSGIFADDLCTMTHERLAIVDLEHGAQPLFNESRSLMLTVNGEIYNHKKLRERSLKRLHHFLTNSDCEIILHLYTEIGDEVAKHLDGDFSFVLYDRERRRIYAARDPIGVTSLYLGRKSEDGSIWISSELKTLKDDCDFIQEFPPGHYFTCEAGDASGGQFTRYFDPFWWNEDVIPHKEPVDLMKIRRAFEESVVKRLMTDVPYGVLLSGGLDSSLVAAVASRHAEGRVEEEEKTRAWWPRLHSFSIGLHGASSPDLVAAREVSKYLKTVHHELTYTLQEGLDALSDVIWHLETYDVTTIRASTPMYLLARKIKATGVKMVLSGEGSDEIYGGYLYFYKAPNVEEFHRETVKRVKALHYFDCLRANKSTMAWGLEVRVPFLDIDFLNASYSFDPAEKMPIRGTRIEKDVLRRAFEVTGEEQPYLPRSILWRQKEQFSDGVGYGWIDGLKEFAEKNVTEEEFANRAERFPDDTPDTKEAYYYRRIFEEKIPQKAARETVRHWQPTWGANKDPSGRAQDVHVASTVAPAAEGAAVAKP